MDKNSTIKLLAILLFVSAGVASFSLGALAYTFATGDLPFGLIPIIHEKPVVPTDAKVKAEKPKEPASVERMSEQYLEGFYQELKQARTKVADEKQKLDARQKILAEIKDEAIKMQGEIDKSEKRLNSVLDNISQKEAENAKKVAAMMSSLDRSATLKMLNETDETIASRILYFMNQKISADLISMMMNSSDKDQPPRARRLTEKMRLISEEMKNE
jgi:hypothetical protein